MLKVIILRDYEKVDMKLIEELSNSTNQQSKVEEADRRSNEKVQYELQEKIYNKLGMYFERKKGEFYYGLERGYIPKDLIVDRYDFFRAYLAYVGQPRWARQKGSEALFRKTSFDELFSNSDRFVEMAYAYTILVKLYSINSESTWGDGIRYGKMAVIAAIGKKTKEEKLKIESLEHQADLAIEAIKPSWSQFESWVIEQDHNKLAYQKAGNFDFDNYYKGKTINSDIETYFNLL